MILISNDFWHEIKMYNFEPYNVLLAITTNIPYDCSHISRQTLPELKQLNYSHENMSIKYDETSIILALHCITSFDPKIKTSEV